MNTVADKTPARNSPWGRYNIRPFVTLFCMFFFFIAASLAVIWFFLLDTNEARIISNIDNNVRWVRQEILRTVTTAEIIIDQFGMQVDRMEYSHELIENFSFFDYATTKTFAIGGVWLTNAAGTVVFTGGEGAVRGADHSRCTYFLESLRRGAHYYGSDDNVLIDNAPCLIVTGRINDSRGGILGVVGVAIKQTFLDKTQGNTKIGTDDSCALITSDGVILARSPLLPNILGAKVKSDKIVKFLSGKALGDSFMAAGTNKGPRYVGLARVEDKPLVAVYTVVLMDSVKESFFTFLWVLIPVVIGLAFMSLFLVRTIRSIKGSEEKRRQAEELLRRNESRLRRLVENMPVMLLALDEDMNILVWNRECQRVTGYSAEEIVGRAKLELFFPDKEYYNQFMTEWAEKEDFINWELDVARKDGTRATTSWSSISHNYPVPGWANWGVGIDVTDRKKAEEEKAHLESQLQQARKMEAVGVLASGVAHDFNNILQSVSGNVQLLIQSKLQGDQAHRHLEVIDGAVQRAADLIKRLMTFSRKVEPELKPVDMVAEVRQVTEMLERTIPKMIRIRMETESDEKWILADSSQLDQVLMNLAVNARDAMPEGGDLVFGIRDAYSGKDFIHAEWTGGQAERYVLLTVSDTGQGMDEETKQHIFDPFFTTKDIGRGSGLGLATVYGIVKSHHGFITCESVPGRGSSFLIYWPAASGKLEAESVVLISDCQASGAGELILAVDDEWEILEVVKEFLETQGYRVVWADCGERAVEIYQEMSDQISLVLMDLGMPGMGGLKALEEILGLDSSARVLIASGYAADLQIRAAMDAGAKGFIAKPYRLANLLGKIAELCS